MIKRIEVCLMRFIFTRPLLPFFKQGALMDFLGLGIFLFVFAGM